MAPKYNTSYNHRVVKVRYALRPVGGNASNGSLREVECRLRSRRRTLHTLLQSAGIIEINREVLSATNQRCPIEWVLGEIPAEIQADERLLEHIFTNLLTNARPPWGQKPIRDRCLCQAQWSFQQFSQMSPHEKPSQRVQVRLKFKTFYENAERRIKRRVTELCVAYDDMPWHLPERDWLGPR